MGYKENIFRMIKSNYYFIDGTFHHPIDFKKLLITIYHNIKKVLNILCFYILINSKKEFVYIAVLNEVNCI